MMTNLGHLPAEESQGTDPNCVALALLGCRAGVPVARGGSAAWARGLIWHLWGWGVVGQCSGSPV